MSWEDLARKARSERMQAEARTRAEFQQVTTIQHPGFSNPVAIKNEQYRIEGKIEKEMRGGWTKSEARQRLADRGDPDF